MACSNTKEKNKIGQTLSGQKNQDLIKINCVKAHNIKSYILNEKLATMKKLISKGIYRGVHFALFCIDVFNLKLTLFTVK